MPYVNIKITKDGVTREQKAAIIAQVTQTLVRVLGKKPEHTHIVIDEVETDNWGFAGELTTAWRAKQQASKKTAASRAVVSAARGRRKAR
jgi:4-oxalocrotonate tautomerase